MENSNINNNINKNSNNNNNKQTKERPGLFNNTKGVMHLCVVGYSTFHGQYEVTESGRSSKNSDLSVEQFSVWVKHFYAVSFLSFGSYSAHFLDFKLDSAQTES